MTNTTRRRTNGTVDIDYYRAQALSERRTVINASVRKLGRGIRAMVAALAMPAGRPMPDPGMLMLIAQAATKRTPI